MTTYKTQIIERHLDVMGHVNNSVYLELYEQARWDYITQKGFGLVHVKESGFGPVIIEVQVKYKKELKNRENIEIKSKFLGPKNHLIVQLSQEIYNEAGKLASSAIFDIAIFDMNKRRLIAPTKEWLDAISTKG